MTKTERGGIYIASRARIPERSAEWRRLRASGAPIISTWIDEAGPGETKSFSELWARITSEIARSDGLLLYLEPDDLPLKGTYVEAGMALAMCKPVAIVRPKGGYIGSWVEHPSVRHFFTTEGALQWLSEHAAGQQNSSRTDDIVWRLRGRYGMGTKLPNGHPEFGYRQFEVPPIQLEAADEIERLRAGLRIIAGREQPADNLMSNVDVAVWVLDGELTGEGK